MAEISEILVVEDDCRFRDAITATLTIISGANVTGAADLESALKAAKERKPDLCFSDGRFPASPIGVLEHEAWLNLYEQLKIMYGGKIKFVLIGDDILFEKAREMDIEFLQRGDIWEGLGRIITKYRESQ